MSMSMRDVDPAFKGAGQKVGLEIWRIENFQPVAVPKASYGKFQSGNSYIVLKTTVTQSGDFYHAIHYWLGKDTSEDEKGTAAIKSVELDAALGGRAVQHREPQGHETDIFLSYFKPCIIPEEGGGVSGFKRVEENEYPIRLFACKGKHVVHVKEVPYSRSSLDHDDVFILDTKSKIFQFNGFNSAIQGRAKALEVVQYINNTYHDGKCELAAIEDGKFVADPETGEFWSFFGGFAPLAKKSNYDDESQIEALPPTLLCMHQGVQKLVQSGSLTRDLLDANKCYLLDCGIYVYVWMGRNTTLDERKDASSAAEKLAASEGRSKQTHITCVMEGFENVMFKSKFDSWPPKKDVALSEGGRGKVAAMLKRQGLNIKGFLKAAPLEEEYQQFIDCSGNLKVWRVDGNNKVPLPLGEQHKFYTGDCYILQYNYPGEKKEECLICGWIGKKSVQDERHSALLLMNKMVESFKAQPVQAKIYEGKEPSQFFAIFQSFVLLQGGLSTGYKNYITEKGIEDDTYKEDGTALFRIQGGGPDNIQAIQVDAVASSLNSSYAYILQVGSSVFTWLGSLTTTEDHELVERMLDLIKPDIQSKLQKEGTETQAFWDVIGGPKDYSSQKIFKDTSKDPLLFACSFPRGPNLGLSSSLEVTQIYNFTQDDLMTEDMMILDCFSEIYVWVGHAVDVKLKQQALDIGRKYLEKDVLLEDRTLEIPVFVTMEGSEPSFFTRFFSWDAAKSAMHENSFQRKLFILKNGTSPPVEKPKRRSKTNFGGRSSAPDKTLHKRSVSFSPDRTRPRGRSPQFNALASAFESPSASESHSSRATSTPPPVVRKVYPKSVTPDTLSKASIPKSASIAALTSKFEPFKEKRLSGDFAEERSNRQAAKPPKPEGNSVPPIPTSNSMSGNNSTGSSSTSDSVEVSSKKEDAKEVEAENIGEQLIFPYERLIAASKDPAPGIDIRRRETYLSPEEFYEIFGMTKEAFLNLPKWKQNTLKEILDLF